MRATSAAFQAVEEESTAAGKPDRYHDHDHDGRGTEDEYENEDEGELEPLQDDITTAAAAATAYNKSALVWDEAIAQVQQSLAAHRQSTEELDRRLTKSWNIVCGMAMNPNRREEGANWVDNMRFDFPWAILG